MHRSITFGLLASTGVVAFAQAQQEEGRDRSLEVALSDETAQVRYIDPQEILGNEAGELSYALFLSEDRDVVGSAAALVGSTLSAGALQLRVGPQAHAALLSEENNDVFALSFGVEARFDIARNRGLAVVGSAFWSPDVLTFGSADNLTDFMARAEMELTDRLLGFAGYRWFELDLLDREDRKLQDEIFAGVRWALR